MRVVIEFTEDAGMTVDPDRLQVAGRLEDAGGGVEDFYGWSELLVRLEQIVAAWWTQART